MIPRIRTVKPEFFKHEDLFEAEQSYRLPLRLAFIALWTCCDREGRFRWKPKRLKLDMLPYDTVDMAKVLEVLVERGFIKKYQHQGEWYGCIPSWLRHQYINQREAASEIPSLFEVVPFEAQKKDVKKNTANHFPSAQSSVCDESESVTIESPVIEQQSQALSNEVLPKIKHVPKNINYNKAVTNNFSIENASNSLARACTCVAEPCTCGREGKGREREEEGKEIIVAPNVRLRSGMHDSQTIFEHWKAVMLHPQAKLDPKRTALIRKALNFGYNVEQLCQAITGCSLTPHNIGQNDRGQRYDGLHVILRDSDQIDRFMHNYHYPPRILSEAERKTAVNVQSLKHWVNQKMQAGVVNATV